MFLDIGQHSDADASYCIFRGEREPVRIDLPPSIAHRMFCLGQAYGLRQFRRFESGAKFLIGQAEVVEFRENLEALFALVNDDVLHMYAARLINAIEALTGTAFRSITVSAGSFYD
jgi:hypothetical protein